MASFVDAFRGQLSTELFNSINKAINQSLSGINNYFTFNPGGVEHLDLNIYTDWTKMMAVMNAFDGPKTLYFDGNPTNNWVAEIPAGTWDMYQVVWKGNTNITCKNGCKITNLTSIAMNYDSTDGSYCIIQNEPTSTTPVFDDLPDFTFRFWNIGLRVMLVNLSPSTHLISVPDAANFAGVALQFTRNSGLGYEGFPSPYPVVRVGTNCFGFAAGYDNGLMQGYNSWAGPGLVLGGGYGLPSNGAGPTGKTGFDFPAGYSTETPQLDADGGVMVNNVLCAHVTYSGVAVLGAFTTWATAQSYTAGDYVVSDNLYYECTQSHTSADGALGNKPDDAANDHNYFNYWTVVKNWYNWIVKYTPSGAGTSVKAPPSARNFGTVVYKNYGVDSFSLVPRTGETINGGASVTVAASGKVTIVSDGAGNWETI
jgi:hypothetical protein